MKYCVLLALCVLLFVQCQTPSQRPNTSDSANPSAASVVPIEPASIRYDAFGINAEKYDINEFSIQKNESLYLMLKNLDMSESKIYSTIQQAKDKIDVHSFKPKQKYRAYVKKDTNVVKKMVWQPNKVEFVTFSWVDDSLTISRASRPVSSRLETSSGEITSSLYNAIDDRRVRDELVYKMSDIFAWQVDFFNLRKGDTFKILYETEYVNGEFIDVGEITGVQLNHMGELFTAYRFVQGDIDGYYDAEGKSVQKALLKAPFKYDQRISSGFDPNRFHPILKKRRAHNGVDYAAPYGTPILSVGDGYVTRAGYYGAAGRMVKIEHNGTYTTAYMHMSKFANGISRGDRVKQGEVIGYVGNTGRVTGTHLHYGMYKNGHPINPLTVDLPPSKSLPAGMMADFEKLRDEANKNMKSTTPTVLQGGDAL